MSMTTWINKDELLELLHENLLTNDEVNEIVKNKIIVEKLKREKHLWEEPMDSSFSNEIRRSVLRTLTEILDSTLPNSKSVVGKND